MGAEQIVVIFVGAIVLGGFSGMGLYAMMAVDRSEKERKRRTEEQLAEADRRSQQVHAERLRRLQRDHHGINAARDAVIEAARESLWELTNNGDIGHVRAENMLYSSLTALDILVEEFQKEEKNA